MKPNPVLGNFAGRQVMCITHHTAALHETVFKDGGWVFRLDLDILKGVVADLQAVVAEQERRLSAEKDQAA